MLLARRTLENWPHYLFSELAYEERWVMWETCHQMSWVWLRGLEAGPLHPRRAEEKRTLLQNCCWHNIVQAKTVVFSSHELLNLKGCMIYVKIKCDIILSFQFGTEMTDKLEN